MTVVALLLVLILLPPSEGKTRPAGRPLNLDSLSWPELRPEREKIMAELDAVLNSQTQLTQLALTGAAAREFPLNHQLASAPAGPAGEVYTGVLFQALDLPGLSDLGRRRARSAIAIASALWGLVGVTDRIPAYRLSAGMKLPGLGGLNALWRPALARVLDPIAAQQLIIDCRSGPYAAAWKPRGDARKNWVPVRVFRESDGKRSVVSHFAKHTRGLLAHHLLNNAPQIPHTPAQLVAIAADLPGVSAELNPGTGRGTSPGQTLDLILRD